MIVLAGVASVAGPALLPGSNALAAKFDYELRAGGTYSDNIGRDSGVEEEGTIAFVGLSTDVTQATRRIDFSPLSDLDFLHYPPTDFDDEPFDTNTFQTLVGYGFHVQ